MDNILYLSLATKKNFDVNALGDSIPSFIDPKKELTKSSFLSLGFGIAATQDNKTIRLWNDPEELLMYLIGESVDAIVGYNLFSFDFPVLLNEIEPPNLVGHAWHYSDGFKETYKTLQSKSINLLTEVEKAIGHRLKFDQLLSGMFEVTREDKSDFWAGFNSLGIIKRTRAINMLLADVVYLWKVYGVASELGMLGYRDHLNNKHKFEIKLPTIYKLKNPGVEKPF